MVENCVVMFLVTSIYPLRHRRTPGVKTGEVGVAAETVTR
jgi:hypothetical protein